MKRVLAIGVMLVSATLFGEVLPAISTDPSSAAAPAASFVEISVPSHGEQLLGVFYLAGGPGPHPAAVIYHGFPGYEQNLDLAQALRRAGYSVLVVHYRGSWGVKGSFSFQHAIEDADAQIDWLSSPAISARYGTDPSRIIVIGHSMGGFMALSTAAHHPSVEAAVLISGGSIGHRFAGLKPEDKDKAVASYVERVNPVDLLPLAGTSAAALGSEVFDHREKWDFIQLAPAIGNRPTLLITAADGTGPNSDALLQALVRQGNTKSEHIEVQTDHSFSDRRIFLQESILNWLNKRGL